jgi:glycerophosphoryl diester phosphodiesterase
VVPTFSEYLNICKEYNKEAVIEIKDENAYWGTGYANALMLELVNEVNTVGWSNHCTIIAFDGSVYDSASDPLSLPFYNALKTLSTSSLNESIKETSQKLLPKFQKLIWSDHEHESPTTEAYWAINQKNLSIDVDSSVLLASGGANIVKQAHRKGLIVNTWTVNDEKIRNELLAIGVDQISTNIAFSF